MRMKTPKVWKSFNEQLEILSNRGLQIGDEQKALGYLKTIGYYRLSGYFYPFRQIDSSDSKNRLDVFAEGSRFEDVKDLYMFDKKLRQLALDALERIEIAVRVNIAYVLGQYDPSAYKNSRFFNPNFKHAEWLERYEKLLGRESDTSFVKHHLQHYQDLPVWAACELWDFGTMSMLYKGMLDKDKERIAKFYRLKDGRHLQTHLHAFNVIRNVSAHHSRLWNRQIPIKASLKGLTDSQWQQLSANQVFVYFCLMKRMLDIICPNSKWGKRFLMLLDEFPQVSNNAVNLKQMGILTDPKSWHLWHR